MGLTNRRLCSNWSHTHLCVCPVAALYRYAEQDRPGQAVVALPAGVAAALQRESAREL